jgi:hypothetical protein
MSHKSGETRIDLVEVGFEARVIIIAFSQG